MDWVRAPVPTEPLAVNLLGLRLYYLCQFPLFFRRDGTSRPQHLINAPTNMMTQMQENVSACILAKSATGDSHIQL
jgi:hypothetical protein